MLLKISKAWIHLGDNQNYQSFKKKKAWTLLKQWLDSRTHLSKPNTSGVKINIYMKVNSYSRQSKCLLKEHITESPKQQAPICPSLSREKPSCVSPQESAPGLVQPLWAARLRKQPFSTAPSEVNRMNIASHRLNTTKKISMLRMKT